MFGNVVGYFDPARQGRIYQRPWFPSVCRGNEYNTGRLPAVAFPWGRVLELLKQVEASRHVAYDVCACVVST